MRSEEGRRHYDHHIPHVALQLPLISSFVHLFAFRCDQALITLTDFDLLAFHSLEAHFAPLQYVHSIFS
jgi:hypothetical protein